MDTVTEDEQISLEELLENSSQGKIVETFHKFISSQKSEFENLPVDETFWPWIEKMKEWSDLADVCIRLVNRFDNSFSEAFALFSNPGLSSEALEVVLEKYIDVLKGDSGAVAKVKNKLRFINQLASEQQTDIERFKKCSKTTRATLSLLMTVRTFLLAQETLEYLSIAKKIPQVNKREKIEDGEVAGFLDSVFEKRGETPLATAGQISKLLPSYFSNFKRKRYSTFDGAKKRIAHALAERRSKRKRN